jgi:hypothetical protein
MSNKTKKELDFSQPKKTFEGPKLKFLKPKLIKHGDATKMTHGPEPGFFATAIKSFWTA